MVADDQTEISFSIPQGTLPYWFYPQTTELITRRMRLVTQPSGLRLGFALHLVIIEILIFITITGVNPFNHCYGSTLQKWPISPFFFPYSQWCIGGGGIRRIPTSGFFWQRILTSVIINKQGTFRPFATPVCVYPPPFLAIHHCLFSLLRRKRLWNPVRFGQCCGMWGQPQLSPSAFDVGPS